MDCVFVIEFMKIVWMYSLNSKFQLAISEFMHRTIQYLVFNREIYLLQKSQSKI